MYEHRRLATSRSSLAGTATYSRRSYPSRHGGPGLGGGVSDLWNYYVQQGLESTTGLTQDQIANLDALPVTGPLVPGIDYVAQNGYTTANGAYYYLASALNQAQIYAQCGYTSAAQAALSSAGTYLTQLDPSDQATWTANIGNVTNIVNTYMGYDQVAL